MREPTSRVPPVFSLDISGYFSVHTNVVCPLSSLFPSHLCDVCLSPVKFGPVRAQQRQSLCLTDRNERALAHPGLLHSGTQPAQRSPCRDVLACSPDAERPAVISPASEHSPPFPVFPFVAPLSMHGPLTSVSLFVSSY